MISDIIQQLGKVTDDNLSQELLRFNLSINDNKYHIAFSCFGVTGLISGLKADIFSGGVKNIPLADLEKIRWTSVFIFKAYITFVYMRSEHLERGLDKVPDDSCLKIYKEIFRRGTKKDKSDTLAQHIRNSLCHGTFEIGENFETINFTDAGPNPNNPTVVWSENIGIEKFDSLCNHIYRFYCRAFEQRQLHSYP